MASTYSQNLGFELPTEPEQPGVWGTTTNFNFGSLIEQAIAGATVLDITTVVSSYTLLDLDGAVSQSRSAILRITGTPVGATEVIVPDTPKVYTVRNDSYVNITIKTATQPSGVILKPAEATILYCTGGVTPEVVNGVEELVQPILPVSGGGTGVDTFTAGFVKSSGGTTPLFTEPTIDMTTEGGGTLAVSNGGLGVTSITSGHAIIGTGTTPVQGVYSAITGQYLSWNGTSWSGISPSSSGVTSFNGRTGAIVPQSGDYASAGYVAPNGSNASGTWNIDITGSIGSGYTVPYAYYANNITVTTNKNVQGTRVVQSGAPSSAVTGNIWYQTS